MVEPHRRFTCDLFLPDICRTHFWGWDSARDVILAYTAWGGVPRYWELMSESGLPLDRAVDHLVLNPLGPLHEEPERLLLEELPPAVALRPILDAIGLGAHRVSEIAARIGGPATSLSRPLQRLMELGLIQREIPFRRPFGFRKTFALQDCRSLLPHVVSGGCTESRVSRGCSCASA